MSTLSSRILGLGAYVPPRVVTNAELATLMETTNEWIIERTGIEERRWAAPGEGGAEMAAKEVKEVYEILRSRDVPRDTQTWNRRSREYMEKIKTGSVFVRY